MLKPGRLPYTVPFDWSSTASLYVLRYHLLWANMSDRITSLMFDFDTTRHEGYGGARIACHDSLRLMPNLAILVDSSGRMHCTSMQVDFFDTTGLSTTFEGWLASWSEIVRDKAETGSESRTHRPEALGLKITVSTFGRIAWCDYTLVLGKPNINCRWQIRAVEGTWPVVYAPATHKEACRSSWSVYRCY
jgi:hypothetical protein